MPPLVVPFAPSVVGSISSDDFQQLLCSAAYFLTPRRRIRCVKRGLGRILGSPLNSGTVFAGPTVN